MTPGAAEILAARLANLARLAAAGELRGQALGMARRFVTQPRVIAAMRDAKLREAAATLPGGPWERAEAMAELARLVAVRRAPRWRLTGPPQDAAPAELALFAALELGASLPDHARTYWNLLVDGIREVPSTRRR